MLTGAMAREVATDRAGLATGLPRLWILSACKLFRNRRLQLGRASG